MFRMIFAATAMMGSTAAFANTSAVFLQGESAHVRYGDLDLKSQAGRTVMVGRIHQAAELLCAVSSADSSPFEPISATCVRVAIAQGVSKMNGIGHL